MTFGCFGRRSLLSDNRTKQAVISVLGSLASRGLVNVSAFVIMPDHVHAILWFDDDIYLPRLMQTWKRTSGHYVKKIYESDSPEMVENLRRREGSREIVSIWQRRYHDFNIFSAKKLNEKIDYIHYNPVERGLCRTPEEYLWSSARFYSEGKSVGVKIKPIVYME